MIRIAIAVVGLAASLFHAIPAKADTNDARYLVCHVSPADGQVLDTPTPRALFHLHISLSTEDRMSIRHIDY